MIFNPDLFKQVQEFIFSKKLEKLITRNLRLITYQLHASTKNILVCKLNFDRYT